MINKRSTFISTLLITTLVLPLSALAQEEATDSGTVGEIRQQVEQQVEQRLQEITSRPIGLVGYLQEITETNLVVSDLNQQAFRVSTDEQTEVLQIPGSRTIDRNEIPLEAPLIVIGDYDQDQDRIVATEIQVLPELEQPQTMALVGQVSEILSATTLNIQDTQQVRWEVTNDRSTKYISLENQTLEDFELEEEQQILILGNQTDELEINALVIIPLQNPNSEDTEQTTE